MAKTLTLPSISAVKTAKTAPNTQPSQAPAPKTQPKKAAVADDNMVTLLLPAGTIKFGANDRWLRTQNWKGRERWFDTNKKTISYTEDKKGIHVTLPRSEAAHRNMLELVEQK